MLQFKLRRYYSEWIRQHTLFFSTCFCPSSVNTVFNVQKIQPDCQKFQKLPIEQLSIINPILKTSTDLQTSKFRGFYIEVFISRVKVLLNYNVLYNNIFTQFFDKLLYYIFHKLINQEFYKINPLKVLFCLHQLSLFVKVIIHQNAYLLNYKKLIYISVVE